MPQVPMTPVTKGADADDNVNLNRTNLFHVLKYPAEKSPAGFVVIVAKRFLPDATSANFRRNIISAVDG
jgi:hypothetical protein